MKNKGRKHKSGVGPFANGNCKGHLCGITRPIQQMSRRKGEDSTSVSNKWVQKKWIKRIRGYFKSQTKEIL
tara:strand:+ start:15378 stop:15590 length:213 start_codon:yes stop_codon:yes gene_type:complete